MTAELRFSQGKRASLLDRETSPLRTSRDPGGEILRPLAMTKHSQHLNLTEERSPFHLILNLHRDALGEGIVTGCVESLETYDLAVRFVRHINPLKVTGNPSIYCMPHSHSLTVVPGPSPSIASEFFSIFRGVDFSLARAKCRERNRESGSHVC